MFRLLGLHCGPEASVAAAASLSGVTPARARPVLAELIRAHLVSEPAPGRYTLHDLLRAYAAELVDAVDTPAQRDSARRRMLDHYLHTGYTASMLLDPFHHPAPLPAADPGTIIDRLAGSDEAKAWFAAEYPVLIAAIGQAANGYDSYAWQLCWVVTRFADWQGHWHEWAAAQGTALAAAQRLGDPRGQAFAHAGLARVFNRLTRDQDADRHIVRAAELFAEVEDPAGEAYARLNRANLLGQLGRVSEAIHTCEVALGLFRAAGNQVGEAMALNGLCWYLAGSGEYQRALQYGEQSMAILRGRESTGWQMGNTWDSLGSAHLGLGNHAQAAACFQEAITLLLGLDMRWMAARPLVHLGDVHAAAGDATRARKAWHQALAIFEGLDPASADGVRRRLRS